MATETTNSTEEWIFSLHLPPGHDQRVVQLVSRNSSNNNNNKQPQVPDGTLPQQDDGLISPAKSWDGNDDDEDDEEGFRSSRDETTGLIITEDLKQDVSCWKLSGPNGRTLQSQILLQLSFRPPWQGIPEFTKTQTTFSKMTQKLKGCCTLVEGPEQILHHYTTRDIVKVEPLKITIRGLGPCHALHVFLKPFDFTTASDDVITEGTDGIELSPLTTTLDLRNKPFQEALVVHQERFSQQTIKPYNRFTEPGDSLSAAAASAPTTNDENENYIVMTFAIPVKTESKYDPPLLWKVQLPNQMITKNSGGGGGGGILLDHLTVLDGKVQLEEPPTHVYVQGYQSWSFTGSIWKGQPQPQPALPDMFSRAFGLGGTLPKEPTTILPVETTLPENIKKQQPFYQSHFFTCLSTGRGELMDETGGPALVCGWLSQHEQFGIIAMDEQLQHVTMHASHQALVGGSRSSELPEEHANASSTTTTDWAYAQLVSPHHYDEEPMVHFLHAAAAYNQAKPLQNGPLSTGWCSWYHYYENISQENLRDNFDKLSTMKHKVPTNVAVVDDGYMTAWGDWDSLKPHKFNNGLTAVRQDIERHRMRPGLWLAPFACDKHSTIVRKHPEWIIRNDLGVPANSSNCGKFFYGLDATNPHVRAHAYEAIRRAVHDWGFQVLKIDFLYAACLEGNGKYDLSMTRAQAMHLALQTIRDAAGPNVFLIGCGCPIGSAIGYVDGMRVSADTGPTWYPALPLPWWDHSTLPALRAMLRNSITRAPMGHRWWHNDPDCLLLGETTSLTNDEVASAASIVAMTCGMMLLSDDLTKVSIPRMRILTKIFPMTGATAIVLNLHTTQKEQVGMPSILRLWCTDKYSDSVKEEFRTSSTDLLEELLDDETFLHHGESTHYGRRASFNMNAALPHPNERRRNCIHVAEGLGTWTVISLSNWSDATKLLHIPQLALEAPPTTGWGASASATNAPKEAGEASSPTTSTSSPDCHGYHVFSFWSSRYNWVSVKDYDGLGNGDDIGVGDEKRDNGISRHLGPHQTEIFHIRPVTPGRPQYVGSDLHFSCGQEVAHLELSPSQTAPEHRIAIQLKTNLNRVGHVFVYVPTVDTSHVKVRVAGEPGRWNIVANTPTKLGGGLRASSTADGGDNSNSAGGGHCCGRILRVMVVVHADGSPDDGYISIDY